MSKLVKVEVPDIGDFTDVDVIEVLVNIGDTVAIEDALITLESEKAAIEIPSPHAGTIKQISVNVNDKVSQGDVILEIETSDATTTESIESDTIDTVAPDAKQKPSVDSDIHAEVVVLGSGPGGYTAAFRAADLGKQVVLIEKFDAIGGVCLNVGCIPSKTLLHTAQIINEADEMSQHGVTFGKPKIDLEKIVGFKNKIIGQLTGGLAGLAKQRKVKIINGYGKFTSATTMEITGTDGVKTLSFDNAIIAAGSSVMRIPGFPYDDPRLMDSTGALELKDIPKRLLVIGGGIIGLEMAMVYDALGSKVSIVELSPGLMPGCDRDLVRPLDKRIKKRYENIWLNAKVTNIEAQKAGLKVSFEGDKVPETDTFDRVLLAVGRSPNGGKIDAENAGVIVDERGFIAVDRQQKTNVANIYAIGDIVGQPMLAHKATHEGKTAAEVIAGMKSFFDAKTIPSVAYTDPEVAWMGITEEQAKAEGIDYEKGAFPWAASGRSLSIGRSDGLTKVLFDKTTKRLIGAGMVGPNAGELIAEAVLALEMGADIEDIALTVHPHPTLSETFNFAAEMAEGTITDLYIPKNGYKVLMENKYAIMFADIAGSTSMYDTLGNQVAEKRIADCIQTMSEITSNNNGRVVKTIGDEIMACFNTSNDAAKAALEIQTTMENSDESPSIRIGMQYGNAIDKDGDIYGDAVNVAARMAGVAEAKQIITTEYLVKELDERLAEKSRLFDTAKVKGKDEELKIYQINWEEESKVTRFATALDIKKVSSSTVAIALKFAGEERLYTDQDVKKAITIGRDKSNDIALDAAGYASRSHVDLDFRRGKFVLIDHSTNGTYVRFKGQDDMFIRREELPLMGEGVINLGEVITEENSGQISFNILQPSS